MQRRIEVSNGRVNGRALFVALVFAAGTGASATSASAEPHRFTFSWQFAPDDAMRPRGGTTKGAPIKLAKEPSAAWRALQEPGLTKLERDRRAILAMAGAYRTSFDFLETVGFKPGFAPSRPYQSWSTEYVYVVEDGGTFIRLQHLMVLFVTDKSGKLQGPFVQKHWRQDWRYEDTDLHVFVGGNRWERRTRSADDVRGRWSQAVFQVDDSPRYEAIGAWQHEGSYSAWTSEHHGVGIALLLMFHELPASHTHGRRAPASAVVCLVIGRARRFL